MQYFGQTYIIIRFPCYKSYFHGIVVDGLGGSGENLEELTRAVLLGMKKVELGKHGRLQITFGTSKRWFHPGNQTERSEGARREQKAETNYDKSVNPLFVQKKTNQSYCLASWRQTNLLIEWIFIFLLVVLAACRHSLTITAH